MQAFQWRVRLACWAAVARQVIPSLGFHTSVTRRDSLTVSCCHHLDPKRALVEEPWTQLLNSQPFLPSWNDRSLKPALLGPAGIPKLMLVAWRIKEWVEPLLYRIIALGRGQLPMLPAITSKFLLSAINQRPSFFHGTVRHLMVAGVKTTTFESILSVCTSVDNLWVNHDLAQLQTIMEPLRLKHLYTKTLPFLRTLTPLHPFFSQITHLELMDTWEGLETWSELYLIPQLTHLSFIVGVFFPLCVELLGMCKSLAVLVFLRSPSPSSVAELSHDFRFVVMQCFCYHLDWQMGVHAGRDYWSCAESFIAKRRSGEIDALQYEILVNESRFIALVG
ncbi:hypothetical protein C8R44DRAFT_892901 [Mycena epipterygia]|nr:hypothetical protein C8R44DRAFT_892901 [Mycena epipterygia]